MKKTIICTFALCLFALPMSLHATPPAKGDAEKSEIVKPLSAMKATAESPSKTDEKAAEGSEKALEEKADDPKKTAKDAEKAKKDAGK